MIGYYSIKKNKSVKEFLNYRQPEISNLLRVTLKQLLRNRNSIRRANYYKFRKALKKKNIKVDGFIRRLIIAYNVLKIRRKEELGKLSKKKRGKNIDFGVKMDLNIGNQEVFI